MTKMKAKIACPDVLMFIRSALGTMGSSICMAGKPEDAIVGEIMNPHESSVSIRSSLSKLSRVRLVSDRSQSKTKGGMAASVQIALSIGTFANRLNVSDNLYNRPKAAINVDLERRSAVSLKQTLIEIGEFHPSLDAQTLVSPWNCGAFPASVEKHCRDRAAWRRDRDSNPG